jgi:hypothetical protein
VTLNEPHRQHVYQRLVDAGTRPPRVAAAAGVAAVVLSATALVGRGSGAIAWAGLALGVGLFAWAWNMAARLERGRVPLPDGAPESEIGGAPPRAGRDGWPRS